MPQRRNLIKVTCLAAFLAAAGLWVGCTVSFDHGHPDVEGRFPCESEQDCVDGFECSDDGFCVSETSDQEVPCIDEDNDGYGVGPDRRNCPDGKLARDCDDSDPSVNPGEAELCDGIDNNCDGGGPDGAQRVDEFDCPNGNVLEECGSPPSDVDFLQYRCIQGSCVLVPPRQKPELQCDQMHITCNSAQQAFTYEVDGQTHPATDVPEDCR